MKSDTTKHLVVLAFIFLGVFIVYEIFSVISAGEATIAKIVEAPFTGLSSAWSALVKLFSFGSSTAGVPTVSNADTAGINNPNTGQPITADSALGSLLLGSTAPAPASSGINWSTYPTS
ncbi:MAG: hypothetical protein ACLP7I_12045 [Limisphaerales bacterium]